MPTSSTSSRSYTIGEQVSTVTGDVIGYDVKDSAGSLVLEVMTTVKLVVEDFVHILDVIREHHASTSPQQPN